MGIIQNVKTLPGNTRRNLLLVPFWGIPYALVNSYGSLYMVNMGLSASEAGLAGMAASICKALCALAAGGIVNRLGRRLSSGFSDILGWALSMLVLAFARDFPAFLAANMIVGITAIGQIGSACYQVEDMDPRQRLFSYNAFSLISALCTLAAPLGTLWIAARGFLPAVKAMYGVCAFSMLTGGICKLVLLRETGVGQKMKRETPSLKKQLKRYPELLRYIFSNQHLLFLLVMQIVFNCSVVINNLVYYPYLQWLGFSEVQISVVTAVSTGISFIAYLWIIPSIRNLSKALFICTVMFFAGSVLLLAAGKLGILFAWITPLFWAGANAIMNPVLHTAVANAVEDTMRADVWGTFNAFSLLILSPVGAVGGRLFDHNPIYPVILLFLIYLAGGAIYVIRAAYKSRGSLHGAIGKTGRNQGT